MLLKTKKLKKSPHKEGQDVCDVEAGNICGEDEAKIKDAVENFSDKSMEFERELSKLDESNVLVKHRHTGTSQGEKANGKITGENLDDTDHGLEQHECDGSKDSMKEFDDAEQYDTAEEYG